MLQQRVQWSDRELFETFLGVPDVWVVEDVDTEHEPVEERLRQQEYDARRLARYGLELGRAQIDQGQQPLEVAQHDAAG